MIKHAFASVVPDGAEIEKIQPSDWNAAHVIEIVTSDPVTPLAGDLWMLATGSGSGRLLELKFCDVDSVVITLFTHTR